MLVEGLTDELDTVGEALEEIGLVIVHQLYAHVAQVWLELARGWVGQDKHVGDVLQSKDSRLQRIERYLRVGEGVLCSKLPRSFPGIAHRLSYASRLSAQAKVLGSMTVAPMTQILTFLQI